jgi:hypothetical protein
VSEHFRNFGCGLLTIAVAALVMSIAILVIVMIAAQILNNLPVAPV